MNILVINGGSSTFKFALYQMSSKEERYTPALWKKQIEFKSTDEERAPLIKQTLSEIPFPVHLIGHRVVHGGVKFQNPTPISAAVKKEIQELSKLAPLHNPINLEGIEAAENQFPSIKQFAVFDTAFHASLPEKAWTYPGPWEWREENIRRYGFHGISHRYCTDAITHLLEKVPQRLINCHLGNGCSCTAILNGKSIDTSMGFTPMEGLMMGTRSGSIDPGILLYLQRDKGWSVEKLDQCLNRESGLKGIGGDFDLRHILEKISKNDLRAKLALDIFVYRLQLMIGSYTAALGGLDCLSFTAGIGENSKEVRELTCSAFFYLGLEIDPNKNYEEDTEISTLKSKVKVFVIHTQEEWQIAKEIYLTHLTNKMSPS
jgi:acetate kinase